MVRSLSQEHTLHTSHLGTAFLVSLRNCFLWARTAALSWSLYVHQLLTSHTYLINTYSDIDTTVSQYGTVTMVQVHAWDVAQSVLPAALCLPPLSS